MQELLHDGNPGSEIDLDFNPPLTDTLPLVSCDAVSAYNFERMGDDRYCLTLAVPGFEEENLHVSASGSFLRIFGVSRQISAAGDFLHRGLATKLDYTFLMTRPLDLVNIEARCGLLRIELREQPGAVVKVAVPPRLTAVEALAPAA